MLIEHVFLGPDEDNHETLVILEGYWVLRVSRDSDDQWEGGLFDYNSISPQNQKNETISSILLSFSEKNKD